MEKTMPTPAPDKKSFLAQRLVSLDVYRGLIMITLAFNGFGLAATARNHLTSEPDSPVWNSVYHHSEHAEWAGCGYWDLIQPSFMFMVGVAMAFSYARRKEQGASYPRMLAHAAWRSLVLIFLGIFLISNWSQSTEWSLMNVLTQIGLGYTFLFLLWDRRPSLQWLCAGVILIGTWSLYTLWPGTGVDLSTGKNSEGIQVVKPEWAQKYLQGIGSAWHKNANAGHFIDREVLNLLPQEQPFIRSGYLTAGAALAGSHWEKPFLYNRGGYQTINFLPSLATMLFGLMCGQLLRSARGGGFKLAVLLLAGILGLASGYLLDYAGI
jgi:predicted acyltransferase